MKLVEEGRRTWCLVNALLLDGCDDLVMGFLACGELVVIETDDDLLLGTAEVLGDVVLVRSGFVGRPTVLPHEDVMRVTLASDWLDPLG